MRDKLIEYGVPICRRCGYPLRGLRASDSLQCPECGWMVDEQIRQLMQAD